MSMNTSINDIARIANVSTATVSRVFSDPEKVQEETRTKILKVCDEYGYQPKKYQKRIMYSNHNPFVAIIVADLRNVFFQEIIEYIRIALKEKNIDLIIFDTQESAQNELQYLNLLEQINVDGIFISPVTEKTPVNATILKSIYKKGTPVILIDRDIREIALDGVFQESYTGAFEAVNNLIENGHEHIATIVGPINSKPGADRLNGYLDALKSHQIPIRQEYILYGDFMKESGYQLTKQILKKCPQVTAIFSANNLMSVGALQAIHEAGLLIPQDIAFISFGTLVPFDLFGELSITELEQPIKAMAEECAKVMIERLMIPISLRKKLPTRRISFETPLALKGSEVYPNNRK